MQGISRPICTAPHRAEPIWPLKQSDRIVDRAGLAAGCLVEVLVDVVEPDEEEMHAVFPGGQRMPQRVRVFLDFVVPRLQGFLEGEGK